MSGDYHIEAKFVSNICKVSKGKCLNGGGTGYHPIKKWRPKRLFVEGRTKNFKVSSRDA